MKDRKNKHPILTVFLGIFVIMLTIFIVYSYYEIRTSLIDSTEEQVIKLLESSTENINTNITSLVEEWEDYAELVATLSTAEGEPTSTRLKSYLSSLEDDQDMVGTIYVSDENGKAYDSDGNLYDISDRPYFQDVKENHSTNISDMVESKYDSENSIVISTPILYENQFEGAVVYVIPISSISALLTDASMDNLGTSYLVQQDGTIIGVSETSESGDLALGSNFYEAPDIMANLGDDALTTFQEHVDQNDKGVMMFQQNPTDSDEFVPYTISGDAVESQNFNFLKKFNNEFISHEFNEATGWTIFTVVDSGSLTEYSEDLNKYVLMFTYMCFIGLGIILIVITILLAILFTHIRANERRLQFDHDRMEMMQSFTDTIIYDYNVKSRQLMLRENARDTFCGPIMEIIPQLLDTATKDQPSYKCEINVQDAEGECHWFVVYSTVLYDRDKAYRVLGRLDNIDDQKNESQALLDMAQKDPMTELYNKTTFADFAEYNLNHPDGEKHAFFFIDVDNFKHINDTYGHDAGDQTLIALADLIRKHFRQDDVLGRFGGDEFVVYTGPYKEESNLEAMAGRLCQAVSELEIESLQGFHFSISVGIAQIHEGDQLVLLRERADRALYKAKESGKNRFEIFSEE